MLNLMLVKLKCHFYEIDYIIVRILDIFISNFGVEKLPATQFTIVCIFDIKETIFLIKKVHFWNEHLINNHVPVLFGLIELAQTALSRCIEHEIKL